MGVEFQKYYHHNNLRSVSKQVTITSEFMCGGPDLWRDVSVNPPLGEGWEFMKQNNTKKETYGCWYFCFNAQQINVRFVHWLASIHAKSPASGAAKWNDASPVRRLAVGKYLLANCERRRMALKKTPSIYIFRKMLTVHSTETCPDTTQHCPRAAASLHPVVRQPPVP